MSISHNLSLIRSWQDGRARFWALRLYLRDSNTLLFRLIKIFDAVNRGTRRRFNHSRRTTTYAKAGFREIVDLGEWWKRENGLPLPLGEM